ncbi:MAG: hypothetical protein LBG46_00440 [Elusimicrobiota bacterium]|jgi:hypothetical protein|nr:hypothetical protein [Elusimicrobiota bacterium]
MKKVLFVIMSIALLCNLALAQASKGAKRLMADNYEQAMGFSQDEIEELYIDYEEHLDENKQFQELMSCEWIPDFFGTDGTIETESYVKGETTAYWKSIEKNNGQEDLYGKITDFIYSLNFAFSPIIQVLNSDCSDEYKREIISATLNGSLEDKKNTINPCLVEDFAQATCQIEQNGRQKVKQVCKGKCFKRQSIIDEIKAAPDKVKLFNEALKNSQFGDYK